MSDTPDPRIEIERLTLRYLDGQLGDEETEALLAALRSDPGAADRFVDVCYQDQVINELCSAATIDEPEPDADHPSAAMMSYILEREREARFAHAADRAANPAPRPAKSSYRPAQQGDGKPQPHVIVIPRWAMWGGIAALLVLAVTLVKLNAPAGPPPTQQPPAVAEAPASPGDVAAHLKRTLGARWEQRDGPAPTGATKFRTGERLQLAAGLVEIEMVNGARVLIEGPAELTLRSASAVELHHGRLTSVVDEQARGFEVRTASAVLVDLGTEFGIEIDRAGRLRADVFEGLVSLAPRPSQAQATPGRHIMYAGQAAQVDEQGRLTELPTDRLHYVRQDEFETRVYADQGSVYHRWLAYSIDLHRDPALAAHYVFDRRDADAGRLINRAPLDAVGDGALGDSDQYAPPRWGPGRFWQTRSLAFGTDDDGLNRAVVIPDSDALDLDGDLTVAMWIKTTEATGVWNTLLSKRTIPPSRLTLQLSISGDWLNGERRFQYGAGPDDNQVAGFFATPGGPNNMDPATWQLVTIVRSGGQVRFYVNSVLIHTEDQPMPALTNDAPLLIGTSPSGLQPPIQNGPRPYGGMISEVVILNRPLSDGEISAMYRAGLPETGLR